MRITPNHVETEEDALNYILQETWLRRGTKLISADALLPEAVQVHFAPLSQDVRKTIGFRIIPDASGGKKLMLNAVNAEAFFEQRGTPLHIEKVQHQRG